MKITYHGHACFSVESGGYSIVLDPYRDVSGFPDIDLCANQVICSHSHMDHAYVDGVHITEAQSPFIISSIASFHDDAQGAKRGLNAISVLEAEGKKVVHLGDLGHMLGEDAIEALRGADVLMVPVGGFFTIDANTAFEVVSALQPKMIIPMHYRDAERGLEPIAEIDGFLGLLSDEQKSRLALVREYGGSIEI